MQFDVFMRNRTPTSISLHTATESLDFCIFKLENGPGTYFLQNNHPFRLLICFKQNLHGSFGNSTTQKHVTLVS